MTYYSMREWQLQKIVPTESKMKKYTAIITNKNTGRTVKLHFGDERYQQYKDSTGLGCYTHLDHNDKKRRAAYKARHKATLKAGFYSPGFFSDRYLW